MEPSTNQYCDASNNVFFSTTLVNYLPIFPYFSKEFEKQWTKPNAKNSENNWALTKLFCNFKFANDFDSKAFTFSDFAIYGQMKKNILKIIYL